MIFVEVQTLHCLFAHQPIIDVGGSCIRHWTQNIIHHPLKLTRGVFQTHHIHFPLEDPQGGIGTRVGATLRVQRLLMKRRTQIND